MRKIISIVLAMAVILSSFTALTFAAEENALGPNIAQNKKVTAAGQFSASFGVKNAVDGNINTVYSMTMTEVIGEKINGRNTLVIDLGAPYEISNITVRSRRDMSQGRSGWVLEVASEATYEDSTIVGEKPTAGEFGSDLIVNFATPMVGRYILFYGISGLAEIAEVEAYGSLYTGKSTPVYEDIKDTNYDASKLVEGLGLMQGISISEFGVNKLTRRDEAAMLVAMATGIKVAEKTTSSFSDVESDNEYLKYIEACLDAGLISKGETYRPQDFIRGTEVLKMITVAMGYDSVLPQLGDYPHNVLKLAKDLEITKGVPAVSEAYASREDILRLVYNALLTPVTVVDEFSENVIYYKNGETLLKRAFGVNLKKGIVTENDVTNLVQPRTSVAGSVRIDGVKHFDLSGDLHDLIGQTVYYLSNDDNEIAFGWADKKRQEIHTIFSKDILFGKSTDDSIVVEYDDEEQEEFTIKDEPYVLKNGVAYDDYKINKLKIDSGKILLIDNDGNDVIDTIHIFEPKIIIATHTAESVSGRLMISGANGESVIASNYKYLLLKNGTKKIDTTSINMGDLIYGYVSENKKNYIFEVVGDSVTGVLEELNDDGAVIDGKHYGYSSYYTKNKKNLPYITLGLKATFTIDEHGDIVWIRDVAEASEAETLAVTLIFERPDGLDNAKIKVYTENKEFLELYFAKNVVIDGKKYSQDSLDELMDKNPSYLMLKMARFSKNSNGEIIRMDTENNDPVNEPNSNLKGYAVGSVDGTHGRRSSTGLFSRHTMVLPILEDFPIFVIPCNSDNTRARVGEEYESYYKVTDSAKRFPKGSVSLRANQMRVYAKDEYGSPSIGLIYEPIAESSDHTAVKNYTNGAGLVVDTVTKAYNKNEAFSYTVKGYDIRTGKKTSVILHEDLAYVINADRYQAAAATSAFVANTNLIKAKEFDDAIADPKNAEKYLSAITDLKRGDVIRYETSGGLAVTLERVYTMSDYVGKGTYKTVYTAGDNYPNFASHFKMSHSMLEDFKNNMMMISIGGATEIVPLKGIQTESFIISKGRITKCTAAELPMYVTEGTEFAVFSTSGNYHAFIVFLD